jgi:hypothetical protein
VSLHVLSIPDPTVTSYIAITFGEMELLVTLSGAPNFKVTVWRWRTGEKLASAASGMDQAEQLLKCSQASAVLAAVLQHGLVAALISIQLKVHLAGTERFGVFVTPLFS